MYIGIFLIHYVICKCFFSDHILTHIQELPFITLFLRSALVTPAPLDRVPVVRATGQVDFSSLINDKKKKEENETNFEELNPNLRRSLRIVSKFFFFLIIKINALLKNL